MTEWLTRERGTEKGQEDNVEGKEIEKRSINRAKNDTEDGNMKRDNGGVRKKSGSR